MRLVWMALQVAQIILYRAQASGEHQPQFESGSPIPTNFSLPFDTPKEIVESFNQYERKNECLSLVKTYYPSCTAVICLPPEVEIQFLEIYANQFLGSLELKDFPVKLLISETLWATTHASRLQILNFLLSSNSLSHNTLNDIILFEFFINSQSESAKEIIFLDYLREILHHYPDLVNLHSRRMTMNGNGEMQVFFISFLHHSLKNIKPNLAKLLLEQPQIIVEEFLEKRMPLALSYLLKNWLNSSLVTEIEMLDVAEQLLKKNASVYNHDYSESIIDLAIAIGAPQQLLTLLNKYDAKPSLILSEQLYKFLENLNKLMKNSYFLRLARIIPSLLVFLYYRKIFMKFLKLMFEHMKFLMFDFKKKRAHEIKLIQQKPKLQEKKQSKISQIKQLIMPKISLQEKLLLACEKDDVKQCEQLHEAVDFNQQRVSDGFSPLMLAIRHNSMRVIQYLLSRPGIQIDLVNKKNQNALMIACLGSSTYVVDLILKLQLAGNIHIGEDVSFHQIVETCTENMVKHVLHCYFSADRLSTHVVWGDMNDSLLMHLVKRNFLENIKYLISVSSKLKALQINYVNLAKETALLLACKINKPDIAKYFLQNFENIKTNLKDENNFSALYYAVSFHQISLAKKLIEQGAELTNAIKKSKFFSELKAKEQQELIKSIPPISAPVTEKIQSKSIIESKENYKNKTNLKNYKKPPMKLQYRQQKRAPVTWPHIGAPKSIQPPKDRRKNFIFSDMILGALKNLALVYSIEAKTCQEIFSRHCQMTGYIFDLFSSADYYNKILQRNYVSRRGRALVDTEDFKSFRNAIGHRALPWLLSGENISSLQISSLDAVEQAVKKIIDLMPQKILEKIVKLRNAFCHFNNQEIIELYNILGTQPKVIDENSVPEFPICDTPLYQLLVAFHEQFIEVDQVSDIQENYLYCFALPLLKEFSEQLAYDSRVWQINQQQSHLLKSEPVLDWNSIKEYYLPEWRVLTLILVSCGDIAASSFYNTPLYSFVLETRKAFRNPFLHYDKNDNYILVNDLCKKARQLATELECKPISWYDTVYGEAQKKKWPKPIVQSLTHFNLFAKSNINSLAPATIIMDYLGHG